MLPDDHAGEETDSLLIHQEDERDEKYHKSDAKNNRHSSLLYHGLQSSFFKYFIIGISLLYVSYLYLSFSFRITLDKNSIHKYTIRVNSFRRNDLLEKFLAHYTTCNEVDQIQVVWSDQKYGIPSDIAEKYQYSRVKFEKHTTDRLSNRFKAISPIETDAVLSIDDDLLISCDQLNEALQVWVANPRTLVGFSPRLDALNPQTGETRYLKWQHTWWNGAYSIMLTKAAFLHKKYLSLFFELLPEEYIQTIDASRNCEDIAMAFVVAKLSEAPPVWIHATLHEGADTGISSGSQHFDARSKCISVLNELNNKRPALIHSYQKALPLSMLDGWRLLWDNK